MTAFATGLRVVIGAISDCKPLPGIGGQPIFLYEDNPRIDCKSRFDMLAGVDRGLALILMAMTGGLIAMQPAVNAGLGRATGNIAAALVSFAIGTLLLAVIVALAGQAGGLGSVTDVPWYYLLGGLLGAAYVFTALVTVSTIGAGGVAAATITGQLSTSIVLDRLGVLGLEQQPITASRIAGVVLLLAGTLLIVR